LVEIGAKDLTKVSIMARQHIKVKYRVHVINTSPEVGALSTNLMSELEVIVEFKVAAMQVVAWQKVVLEAVVGKAGLKWGYLNQD